MLHMTFIVIARNILDSLSRSEEHQYFIAQSGHPDTRKTRHYRNKIAFIKEQVDEGMILPTYVPTELKADRLTKPFGGAKTKRFFDAGANTFSETPCEDGGSEGV
jgi:hypothetical protein